MYESAKKQNVKQIRRHPPDGRGNDADAQGRVRQGSARQWSDKSLLAGGLLQTRVSYGSYCFFLGSAEERAAKMYESAIR